MSDPRLEPAWKQTRAEDKTLLLLGAILDALLMQKPKEVQLEPRPVLSRRQKVE